MTHESRPWLDGVEGEVARELIESNAPVICVVAGPGSGKTFCLKRRTQRLIEGDEIKQKKVFVGTFTRAMATELREELASYQDIKISTLHSLAYGLLWELLRKDPEAFQGMKLRFLLDFERDALLYDIKDEFSFGYYECHDELLEMEASLATPDSSYENAQFRGAVERWLERHQAMLVGYVVYLCVDSLQHGDIQPRIFDYVVIDEYQDLTVAEQELVDLLWSGKGSLTVLGDDNQSIYGFRFNHMKGISEFNAKWTNRGYDCQNLSFYENHRCGDQILDAANRMLAKAGRGPLMYPKSDRPGKLDLVQWDTLEDEVKGLARYIKSRLESQPDEKFLVLVPRRFIGYRLREEIGEEARTMFTQEVLHHKIAQVVFTAASLLADPSDRVAARVWLGLKHGKSEHDVNRNSIAYSNLLRDVSRAVGGHELVRKIVDQGVEVSGIGGKNIKIRAKCAIQLIERDLDPSQVVDYLFDPARAESEADEGKRFQLADSLEKLRKAARNLLEEQDSPDLGNVLRELRYKIAARTPLVPDDEEPRVKIMTLHSAKGLEEDNIVIAGVVDQLIPGPATESEEIKEEGRLLYVGVTRAKDSLIISRSEHIPLALMRQNRGRDCPITDHKGVTCVRTRRSRFIPDGITRPIRGTDWLAANVKPDAEQ